MRWSWLLTVKTYHNTGHDDHEEHQAEKVFSGHIPLRFAVILLYLRRLLPPLIARGFEVEDAVRREGGSQGTRQDGAEGGAWGERRAANTGHLHRILRLFTNEPKGEDDHSECSEKFKYKVSELTDRECLKRREKKKLYAYISLQWITLTAPS